MKQLSNPLLWLLLAFTLFLLGSGSVGFVGPDEPRYADVARAMVRSGDYVTPRLFGSPWFEKPPLYYWLAAIFFRMGTNEIDARLPSALGAILFLWFWFLQARRWFGLRTAALACMILASTLGWIAFAHAAVMDMLFSTTLDAALLLLGLWLWRREQQYLYGFYVLLALATLAKGPAAIVLAGLIALAYIVTYREWKTLGRTLYSPALSFFVVLALPWYYFCYQRNGYAFVEEFFVKHNFGRYTSAALGHGQPAWYFFPILAAGLFPWTPMLLLPVAEVIREGPRRLFADRHKAFLFYWAALTFLFFSFSKNKLPSYILPMLPPLTLWMALIVEPEQTEAVGAQVSAAGGQNKTEKPREKSLAVEGKAAAARDQNSPAAEDRNASGADRVLALQKLALWLIWLSMLLLFTVPLWVSVLAESVSSGLRRALAAENAAHLWTAYWKGFVPLPVIFLLLLPAGFCFFMLWRRDLLLAVFQVLVGVAMSTLGVVAYVSPAINRMASVRTVAQRMGVLNIAGEQVAVSGIPRNQWLGLSFYLDDELPGWNPKTGPASIGYVVAKDGVKVPDANPMIFFPGERLRVWVLPPAEIHIQIQPEPKGGGK